MLDTRVRAAAMLHDVAKTRRLLGDLDAVIAQLHPYLEANQPKEMVAHIDDANARRRLTMLARAGADDRALLEALRLSVADADQESGGENNPSGWLLHEEIADTLLRLNVPKEAYAEYSLSLAKHPGRARSILGAARAMTRAGDLEAAREWYRKLLEQWASADEGTDGLAEARAAVAR